MSDFADAWPFPHAVFDDAFDEDLLDRVLAGWPPDDDRHGWSHFSNDLEEKWAWTPAAELWPAAAELVALCNSPAVLGWMEQLTGIEGLQPDPYLTGGGPHEIRRGGKLGVHADFNRHPVTGAHRRLNALLYLNRDWQDDWGGQLQLWDRQRDRCKTVSPMFNRLVVFATTSTSWHGHPHALACPDGRYRRSMAFYYYTADRPDGEAASTHSTVFVDVPDA